MVFTLGIDVNSLKVHVFFLYYTNVHPAGKVETVTMCTMVRYSAGVHLVPQLNATQY